MNKHTAPRSLSFEVRAADDSGRKFTGIGVPYGQVIDLWGIRETFAPGSVELDPDSPCLIRWEHQETIGKIDSARHTDAGFEITGRISDTPRGREASTLLKDGVITQMSIGFAPQEYDTTRDDDGTELVTHTRALAREFSLVSFPAYSDAKISNVRNQTSQKEENEMDTETTETIEIALNPLRDAITDMKRSLAKVEANPSMTGPTAPQFRSIGEFVKAVARGDDHAMELHRSVTTDATGLDVETHIGSFVKLVQDRRRLVNLFSRGTLPREGMTVDYAQLKSNTLKAGEQTAELTDLAGPGAVEMVTKSAPVRTFGGYTRLSRQVIERLNTAYLNTTLKALGIEYARATNNAMRQEIEAAIQTQTEAGATLTLNTQSATAFDWRDLIVDAAEIFDERGFTIDGLLVSKEDFKALQRLEYASVPALKVNPTDEFSGTLSLPRATGELASVPVHCVFGEYTGSPAFFDSEALESLESPGAPVQLQDENVINLGKDFSLYGYMSFIAPFPTAIVPVVGE